MTTYVAILSGPAQVDRPKVTAKTFPVIEPEKDDEETVSTTSIPLPAGPKSTSSRKSWR